MIGPDPNAVAVMAAVDALPKAFRKLVHEYGARIVTDTYTAGTTSPREAQKQLEIWRDRRQEAFLAEMQAMTHGNERVACRNAKE